MNHLNRSEDSGGVLEGGLSALSGGKGSSSGVLGEGGEAAGHEQRSHIDDSFGGGDAGNREVLEGLCYCLSCAIFAISSVLYEPRLFGGKPQETHAHALGSWCFIAGSLGFAMVTLYVKTRPLTLFHSHSLHDPHRRPNPRTLHYIPLHPYTSPHIQTGTRRSTCHSFAWASWRSACRPRRCARA